MLRYFAALFGGQIQREGCPAKDAVRPDARQSGHYAGYYGSSKK